MLLVCSYCIGIISHTSFTAAREQNEQFNEEIKTGSHKVHAHLKRE